jgi:hypothetical protein
MMWKLKQTWWVWLGLGVVLGLVVGGFWPNTPLHAVATDRVETFAVATGPVDEEVEAVYFLDFYTGDLTAMVLSRQTGKFNALYTYNVNADLGIDPSKSPKYLMVTGVADLRRTGGNRTLPSRSVLYVAEPTSGKVGVFAIPWNSAQHASNQPILGKMVALDAKRFRAVAAAAGPVSPKGKAGSGL